MQLNVPLPKPYRGVLSFVDRIVPWKMVVWGPVTAITCSGPRTRAAVVDDEYGAAVWCIVFACQV
jgi:hypothetical protein